MRVLTISNCPLVAHQGSGYVTLGFAAGLRKRGWTVDAYGPEHYEPWPQAQRARSWRVTLGMLRQAVRCMARNHYDVIEFYGGEAWLALAVLARKPGRKYLLVSHSNGLEPFCKEQLRRHLGTDTHDGGPRHWYQLDTSSLMAGGFRRADALVVVSQNDFGYARERDYQRDGRLLAIENPLREEFLGVPVRFGRRPLIGFCGSWTPLKGAAVIVADMTRVLREFPDARLRLIGVGSHFKAMEYFPGDVCERIEVMPFITDRQELRAAYQECAIAIAASAYESFGLAAAEAMACGCALVASRVGFAAGLQHGHEACLLDAPASPHLYAQVKALLLDSALRERIAAAGYRRVQQLRWASAIDTLAAAYETWLAEQRGLLSTSPPQFSRGGAAIPGGLCAEVCEEGAGQCGQTIARRAARGRGGEPLR